MVFIMRLLQRITVTTVHYLWTTCKTEPGGYLWSSSASKWIARSRVNIDDIFVLISHDPSCIIKRMPYLRIHKREKWNVSSGDAVKSQNRQGNNNSYEISYYSISWSLIWELSYPLVLICFELVLPAATSQHLTPQGWGITTIIAFVKFGAQQGQNNSIVELNIKRPFSKMQINSTHSKRCNNAVTWFPHLVIVCLFMFLQVGSH